MYRYLPKQWKLRIAGSLALVIVLIAVPLMLGIVLVLAAKLWPLLLPIAIVVLVCRILARWRR